MALSKIRNAAAMNYKLSLIKEGEHWMKNLEPALKEKMLFKNPDPEEQNVEQSKQALVQMPLTFSSLRDMKIDYMNPREELPKYTKTVDQIPPFDHGPVSLLTPYDHIARQSVNQVIEGRSHYVLEEGKYDITIDNQQEKANAIRSKEMRARGGIPAGQKDPGITPRMAAELARASLMETTQSL
jgi:hypothetical protein